MHFVRPRRVKSILHGEIVKQQLSVIDAKMIQGKNLREELSADFVTPLCQNSGHGRGRLGIAVSSYLNDRLDIAVVECHDLFCGPVVIVGKTTQECGIRITRLPVIRIEQHRLEIPYGLLFRKIRNLPGRGPHSESEDLLEGGRWCGDQVLMTQSRIFRSVPIASKRVAEIQLVMTNKPNALLGNDGIESIRWFHVGVV